MMLWRVRELLGCAVSADQQEIGRVHDVYFDTRRWIVRHLAIDAGHWPAGRRALVCAASVRRIAWRSRRVDVAVSRSQVQGSPEIDTQQPVRREHEVALHEHYGVPGYWLGDPPGETAPPAGRGMGPGGTGDAGPGGDDRRLYSARVVIGFGVHAMDGEVGYVEDFLVEHPAWVVRYLVVDSRHWWPGRRVLIAPEWITWVSSPELTIHLDLQRDAIRRAPPYDPARPVDRAYEARLNGHYRRPPDWPPNDRAA